MIFSEEFKERHKEFEKKMDREAKRAQIVALVFVLLFGGISLYFVANLCDKVQRRGLKSIFQEVWEGEHKGESR